MFLLSGVSLPIFETYQEGADSEFQLYFFLGETHQRIAYGYNDVFS